MNSFSELYTLLREKVVEKATFLTLFYTIRSMMLKF